MFLPPQDIKPSLADSVDFGELEGAFLNVASQCMNVLVIGVNTRLDVGLQEMLRVRTRKERSNLVLMHYPGCPGWTPVLFPWTTTPSPIVHPLHSAVQSSVTSTLSGPMGHHRATRRRLGLCPHHAQGVERLAKTHTRSLVTYGMLLKPPWPLSCFCLDCCTHTTSC